MGAGDEEAVRASLRQLGASPRVIEGGSAGLISGWQKFVESVERGYKFGLDDYRNELAVLDDGARDSADTISRTLTAIHDQLGLKAEASKAMIEMLTIQGAEEPTKN